MVTHEDILRVRLAIEQGQVGDLQEPLERLLSGFLILLRTGKPGSGVDPGMPDPAALAGKLRKLHREDGTYSTSEGRFRIEKGDEGLWNVQDFAENTFSGELASLAEARHHVLSTLSREIMRYMWTEAHRASRMGLGEEKVVARVHKVGQELVRAYPLTIPKAKIKALAIEMAVRATGGEPS